MKQKSKCWSVFHIEEGLLKNYEGMPKDKKRAILVVSDSQLLIGKSLIVELGSTKNNENHIEWYKYKSSITGENKISFIKPDCIHTVNRKYLNFKNRSYDKKAKITPKLKKEIVSFIKNAIE